MAVKTKSKKSPVRAAAIRSTPISGLKGVRVVDVKGSTMLELRHRLRMPRESFGRLVNVSVRTIASVEAKPRKVLKLQRNYVEVMRLCDALGEVVDPGCLGEWFDTPNDAFGGLKPLEVIERGEIDQLWEMFFRLQSGLPG